MSDSVKTRTGFSEFTSIKILERKISEIEQEYGLQDVLRLEFPQCGIFSREYLIFREVVIQLKEGGVKPRGVLFRATLNKLSLRKNPRRLMTRSAHVPNKAEKDRVLKPSFTPGSTTITPTTPTDPGRKEKVEEFETVEVAVKLSTDDKTKQEFMAMQILNKGLIEKGRNPHISIPFEFFTCVGIIPQKLFGWGKVGKFIQDAAKQKQSEIDDIHQKKMRFPSSKHELPDEKPPVKYHYLITEFSDRGDLFKRIGRSPEEGLMNFDEAKSYALQITFSLYQLHQAGIIHRDFHHANITFKTNAADWDVYYNVRSGTTDEQGHPTYRFFNPFMMGKYDVVKFIDFEQMRQTPVEIRYPSTALNARAPEQLLASMRDIGREGSKGVGVQSFANDVFSLGIMIMDMLLHASTQKTWYVAVMKLPVQDPLYQEIREIINDFTYSSTIESQNHNLSASNALVRRWVRDEPSLVVYIANMVYLLGRPKSTDLPFKTNRDGNPMDYLYFRLFNRMPDQPPMLRSFLEKHQVPPNAINMLEKVLKWNPQDRMTAYDMLASEYFQSLSVNEEDTLRSFVNKPQVYRKVFVIFGDEPASQSRSKLKQRLLQREKPQQSKNGDVVGRKRKPVEQVALRKISPVGNNNLLCSEQSFTELSSFGKGIHVPYIKEDVYKELKKDPVIGNIVKSQYEFPREEKKQQIDEYMQKLNLIDKIPEEEKVSVHCNHCHRRNPLYRCKACKEVYYCNTQCQKYHWVSLHRWECGEN